jgi:8-oxo-dGTP diphosphatase
MGHEAQGVATSDRRYKVIPRTLCFVTQSDDVLLLRGGPHKRLWAGLYNGVGGHIEPREDVYRAAQREIREETGLEVTNLRLRALVHVDARDPDIGIMLFVFTAEAMSREVIPSEEGTLEWLPRDALPAEHIMEDLPVLLPRLLAMDPTDPPLSIVYTYDDHDRLVVSFA